ncbi:hypothetical protein GCM10010387_16030 [Streptomyces inusitatus]|uniref:Uncharacterized protein n=1 Tax=Streptomyces inusitatus TaxID=68221 RepID=A0A918PVJ7_9ACTN|nr:hypothetical protein [Streptomyces inusitatus]GGZ23630.1 hypothetical protein GCM10010387_16030 [Streptomyces inusitatus]
MDRTDDQPEDEAPAESPAESPFRVRDVFQFGRAKDEPEKKVVDTAQPVAAEPPAIPAQVATPAARVEVPDRDGHRLPDWWAPKKDITPPPQPTGDSVKWINGVPHHVPAPDPCEHPAPHEVRAKPTGMLVAFWCADCETQLDVPQDYDELDEETDEETGEDEAASEEEGEGGDTVPPTIRRRWLYGKNPKKEYERPSYRAQPFNPKASVTEWWGSLRGPTRHGLYNGTALAGGFAGGVPQFFTAEVAYLAATYDSWTDFYVCIWYGIAVAIWCFDHKSRSWLPPIALLARIPLVSMVVGVLLYGTSAEV